MLVNEFCKSCLLRKNLNAYPASAAPEDIEEYRHRLRDALARCDGLSSPQIAAQIYAIRRDMFGEGRDYTEIKRYYNDLMLSLWPRMASRVDASEDRLKAAVQYAMVGNYIDFAATENVDESVLIKQLDGAASVAVDPELLDSFRNEAVRARRMVLFTDNCGEIVTDKLLITVLRRLNPELSVTVIVRGRPVLNDATMEDALQVHMEEAADRVLGHGTGMPGAVPGALSPEAMEEVGKADLLAAKGQGNYEGLSGCGLNVFYFFLCKCELFTRRFGVPRFTGVMTREPRKARPAVG